MPACHLYQSEHGYPGCCSDCHRWAREMGHDLEVNPEQPEGDSVCCFVAIWLKQRATEKLLVPHSSTTR